MVGSVRDIAGDLYVRVGRNSRGLGFGEGKEYCLVGSFRVGDF